MFWRKRNFCGNFVMGSATGTFILSIILATVVFDKPSLDTDAYVPEIEMAMVADPMSQRSEVWIDYVFPMHVIAEISKVQKVDSHGVARSGNLADIFPTHGPATGRLTVNFKIELIEESKIPSFANMTYKMVPMFYIRKTSLPEFEKSMFKLTVLCINNLGFIAFMLVVWSFAMMLGGGYLVYKGRTKSKTKPVRKVIIESPVRLKKEMPPNSLLVP